jgi:Phage portal protein
MTVARERYTEEISRLRQFWEQPDKANGLLFNDWLNIALEEILVLDAWAVWPQSTVGGDLHGLQILDGSTIKPLIDDRGMRPTPPYPAFQQILYGFPRSEFAAPTEGESTDGEFTSDELAYMVRNRRAMSVYGYSPTERALAVADIYLRRQQWLRAEYTDGVTPELLMATDANFGNNPDLLRAYENIFNDDLAGQTQQRKRVRLLPAGMTPIQFDGYGERFKDTLDDYLVNSICGHFGVLPSEIGFNPKGGLGGAGFQLGQAESSEVIGAIPLATWIGKMISHLSYTFLGMPRELEFKFMESGRQDLESIARTRDIEIKSGSLTLNEARSRSGLPLIEAPEADMPIISTGTGSYFLTEEGIKPFDDAIGGLGLDGENVVTPVEEETVVTEDVITDGEKAATELKKFLRFLKQNPEREFNFREVPVVYAEVLNKFVSVKDYESARWYAERYLA